MLLFLLDREKNTSQKAKVSLQAVFSMVFLMQLELYIILSFHAERIAR